MTMRTLASTLTLLACSTPAFSQTLHDADFALRINESRIDVGTVVDFTTVQFPFRVKSGVFGAEGIPDFTNDPGFDSIVGSIPAGMGIGFDLTAALREWDGTDFETISDDTVTVRRFFVNTTTPAADEIVPGVLIGTADGDGIFHHHPQYFLNTAPAGSSTGVWLVELVLWSTEPAVLDSEPVYLVLSQGVSPAEEDAAVAWVEANLLGLGGCTPDFSEPEGVLNFNDVVAFLSAFAGGAPEADLAEPFGVLNFNDVVAYLTAFAAGCP